MLYFTFSFVRAASYSSFLTACAWLSGWLHEKNLPSWDKLKSFRLDVLLGLRIDEVFKHVFKSTLGFLVLLVSSKVIQTEIFFLFLILPVLLDVHLFLPDSKGHESFTVYIQTL